MSPGVIEYQSVEHINTNNAYVSCIYRQGGAKSGEATLLDCSFSLGNLMSVWHTLFSLVKLV